MRAFEHARARSIDEAVALLASAPAQARVLAGGTDLLALLKDDLLDASRLVEVTDVAELRGIAREEDGTLRIGAATTLDELLGSRDVQADWPGLRQAAAGVRAPQVTSRGTVAGDLLQWPRCWWFRRGFGLLAMAGGRSLVEAGDNRYHAILGNAGPAKYVHASSLAPALIAAGAQALVRGPEGERSLAVAQLAVTPATASDSPAALAQDEILVALRVPPARGQASATHEVRARQGLGWPLAACSVAVTLTAGVVTEARIVLGHVAPVPWRSEAAEAALAGRALDPAAAARAGAAAVKGARPLSQNAAKVQQASVAVTRALLAAAGMER